MSFFGCFFSWLAFTPVRPRRLAVFVVLASLFVTLSAFVHAETVTFRFDATIGTVFPGIPFDSGVDFAVGDVISGEFSFDPSEGNGGMSFVATQPHDFRLNINGIALSAPSYSITAINDAPIVDFPTASGPIDILEFGGAGFNVDSAAPIVNIDPAASSFTGFLWTPTAVLPGTVDVFDTAMIPADVNKWNQFVLARALRITLRDGHGGAIGFQATIADFSVVPELSTGRLALLLLLGSFKLVRARARSFHVSCQVLRTGARYGILGSSAKSPEQNTSFRTTRREASFGDHVG